MARLWASSASLLPTTSYYHHHHCRLFSLLPTCHRLFSIHPLPSPATPLPLSVPPAAAPSSSLHKSTAAFCSFAPLRLPTIQHRRAISFGVSKAMGKEASVGGSTTLKEREILVQHLLVPEDRLQLLLDLQRRVMQDGEDLSDLATEHSICASKSEGGMLGWISLGRTVPEFEEAAFKAPLNKLVRVKTKHGWHLLQVLSEREASFLRDIDVEDFRAHMQDSEIVENAQFVDVREPDEIATASIEGFKAYPLSQFGQWAPSITEDLDPDKDTYVLCHHGMRSLQAAQWLKAQGFTRLYNIRGGIHAFSVKVDSSIPKY